jgi:hypothetical protein
VQIFGGIFTWVILAGLISLFYPPDCCQRLFAVPMHIPIENIKSNLQ